NFRRTMKRFAVLGIAALLASTASVAHAQIVSVTARAGVFVPIGDYGEATAETDELLREREGTFAFGGSINLDPPLSPFGVRFSADYVTGSTISSSGISDGSDDEGDASTLYVAGDLILTPLPRLIIVQPFAVVGAGYRHIS